MKILIVCGGVLTLVSSIVADAPWYFIALGVALTLYPIIDDLQD